MYLYFMRVNYTTVSILNSNDSIKRDQTSNAHYVQRLTHGICRIYYNLLCLKQIQVDTPSAQDGSHSEQVLFLQRSIGHALSIVPAPLIDFYDNWCVNK